MKTAAEKSSATVSRSPQTSEPFFAKANGGGFFAPAVQPKLKVGEPGSRLEQEADAQADRVMRMVSPAGSQQSAVRSLGGGMIGRLQRMENEEEVQAQAEEEEVVQPQEAEEEEETVQPQEEEEEVQAQAEEEEVQKQEEEEVQAQAEEEEETVQPQEEEEEEETMQPQAEEEEEVQAQAEEEEETVQPQEEEEEEVQAQAEEEEVQKQEEEEVQAQAEEEEETVQPQEEEEEEVQAQAEEEEVQKQEEEEVQAQAEEEEETVQPQEEEEEVQAKLQRKSNGTPAMTSSVESGITGKLTGGQSLGSDTQSFMESRFNADFSNVKIHSDSESAGLSSQLSAKAFTYQNHVFFGKDQYQPGSDSGKRLLAHELTHTIQQGASVQRKVRGTTSPAIQRVPMFIKKGINWVLDRIIPGYTLLNVILGKNIVTDEPVARTGVNIIKGYMRLSPVIGSILFSELEETNTLTQAGAWVEGKVAEMGIDFNDIARRLKLAWEEMSIWKGIDGNAAVFKKYVGPVYHKVKSFSGVVMKKVKELRLEGALLFVGATKLLAALKKDPSAFKKVVDNPSIILKNFMKAVKKGFTNFKNNFGTHFKNALFGWLFGKSAEMGITMPKQFNVTGLFSLIAQLVGASYRQIKAKIIKKLGPGGAAIYAKLESAVSVVKDLVTKGPAALWDLVKKTVVNMKDMIFSKIRDLVLVEIVKAAVLKLVGMLNPAGAIVTLVMTIYRVVKFFIDWWDRIKELARAVMDAITDVALGKLAGAAKYIEKIMAKGMTMVIAFLAGIFGLSGIVGKVKGLIKKISAPIRKAIDGAIGWIVGKAKKLIKKGMGLVKKGKDWVVGKAKGLAQVGLPKDPKKRLEMGMRAAVKAVKKLSGRKITTPILKPVLFAIRKRYGFVALEGFVQNGTWWVKGQVNPPGKENTNVPADSGKPSPDPEKVKEKVATIVGQNADTIAVEILRPEYQKRKHSNFNEIWAGRGYGGKVPRLHSLFDGTIKEGAGLLRADYVLIKNYRSAVQKVNDAKAAKNLPLLQGDPERLINDLTSKVKSSPEFASGYRAQIRRTTEVLNSAEGINVIGIEEALSGGRRADYSIIIREGEQEVRTLVEIKSWTGEKSSETRDTLRTRLSNQIENYIDDASERGYEKIKVEWIGFARLDAKSKEVFNRALRRLRRLAAIRGLDLLVEKM